MIQVAENHNKEHPDISLPYGIADIKCVKTCISNELIGMFALHVPFTEYHVFAHFLFYDHNNSISTLSRIEYIFYIHTYNLYMYYINL